MPELRNAEPIEGIVHIPPPVRQDQHGGPHLDAATWLGVYRAATPGVDAGDNSSIRLRDDNMPQSDVALLVLPSHGGRTRLVGGIIEGGPEFVAEVAATSAWLDRGAKLRLYQDNGVQEYLVWLVLQQRVEWHVLQEGRYVPMPPDPDGIHRSRASPGLWLDGDALARRDLARVLAVLQQGLASPEHAAFIARLALAGEARS